MRWAKNPTVVTARPYPLRQATIYGLHLNAENKLAGEPPKLTKEHSNGIPQPRLYEPLATDTGSEEGSPEDPLTTTAICSQVVG